MTDYSDLVRCLRDCFGEATDADCVCDCDNCLMKDKIVDLKYDDGTVYAADYTECVAALALAAADAIESLMDKLNRREETITVLLNGISDAKAAIADVLEKNIGGIISE